ncbi:MAG: hypothetical protein KF779_16160 [Hyphomonadaceae bacterium]|nr:hypothetical protein [Hyphomonadaceae bacterium]MCA8885252.1 hypothetical protein [Hyphomonadaceae bacterium]
MIGRLAVVALAVGLASCAGLEPAGRNARASGSAPTATPPASQRSAPALPPPSQTAPPATATTQNPPPQLAIPPQQQSAAPAQRSAPPPATPAPSAASQVAAPPSAGPSPTAPETHRADEDIIVPGQVQTQVPPPAGDPRSNEERRADVRSWDQCVTQVQSAFDSDPMRPQLTSPEEYCAQSLGMADRNAVPVSRRQRR